MITLQHCFLRSCARAGVVQEKEVSLCDDTVLMMTYYMSIRSNTVLIMTYHLLTTLSVAVPGEPVSRHQQHVLHGGAQAKHHRGRRLGEVVAVLCLRQLHPGWRRAEDLHAPLQQPQVGRHVVSRLLRRSKGAPLALHLSVVL